MVEGLDQIRDKVKKQREDGLATERKFAPEKDKIWVTTEYFENPRFTLVITTYFAGKLPKLPIDEFLGKLSELRIDIINGGQDKNLHMSPERIIDEVLMPQDWERGLKRLS